ncbi:MAG TPA: condensation domain-containing protein, partial [Ktedonobacteraceae bacterium]|nr:condensation domain-containing protein [Ktedonobacteraceae bacterium]
GMYLYLLDSSKHLVPVGVVGEVHIGGSGLSLRYLNHPELTAEKFSPNPFSTEPGARMYNTGDIARYRSDGTLEYLGRRDQQVKIRGMRVEPVEIEVRLRRHPGIKRAVVVAREDVPGNKRLVAYIVPVEDGSPFPRDLRRYLETQLPNYMIPSAFLMLEDLPLTPNDKLDRLALPSPESRIGLDEPFVAPRTPTEEILLNIWLQVLHLTTISIHDNFFRLGGHSLLATQAISRIRKIFKIELPIKDLLTNPTISALASRVDMVCRQTVQELIVRPIHRISRQTRLPLSFAQKRLWFLDQLEPDSSAYNVSEVVRIKGFLNEKILVDSLNEIVRRHEILRTIFPIEAGEPYALVVSEFSVELPFIDLSTCTQDERADEIARLSNQEALRRFDLSQGPLLRVYLLRLEDQEHVLFISLHHIIVDGWSMGIFHQELSTLYNAFIQGQRSPLPDLPVQYSDFAFWQKQRLQGALLDEQRSYWMRQLAGVSPLLELPSDYSRPDVQKFCGGNYRFTISPVTVGALKALSQQEGVTLFMALLAAFQVLLSRYTEQTDILIGTPIAGRSHAEQEGLIGFFVNILLLRTDLSGDPNFCALLERVREVTLEAFTHQELPVEQLVAELLPTRSLRYNPLFQIMLAFQNIPRLEGFALDTAYALTDAGWNISRSVVGTAKFDVSLFMEETTHGLIATWEYRTDLFQEATIMRWSDQLQALLTQIVEHPTRPLSSLSLLSASQRDHVLALGHSPTYAPPAPANLALLLRQQLHTRADAIALVGGEHHLSSTALLRRATQLAHLLRQQGVGPETAVGVCLPRSLELILALLAIVQAGGVYVPLDPDLPAARLAFQLSDAHVSLLLTNSSEVARLPATTLPCLQLDTLASQLASLPDTPLPLVPDPDAALALLYTSGSSGAPKAVICVQRGVLRLARDPQV